MKVFKKLLTAAAAIVIASSVCSGGYQPLIGNLNTVSAANYGDMMEYEDYLSYRKIDENEDGRVNLKDVIGIARYILDAGKK